MGLDMYLNRVPRYKGTTIEQIDTIESYFDWLEKKNSGNEYAQCTFKEWCGVDESKLRKDKLNYFKQFYTLKYYDWDTEHKYGRNRIIDEVGYWRKANQIHNWFVEHIQDGVDDCNYHREVTEEDLEELRDTCIKVLESCVMTYGKVKNGEQYTKENGWETIYENGKIVIDPSVAQELLPNRSGFFFGSTEYDEYYVESLVDTIKIINKVLEETDFETQAIYYVSSW